MKAKADIQDTIKDIIDYYKSNSTPLIEQFDYIIINGQGIIVNHKFPKSNPRSSAEPTHGFFYEEWGELTIAAFLLYINRGYSAFPIYKSSVIDKYLSNLEPSIIIRNPNANFWEEENIS
mgnify:FL=1